MRDERCDENKMKDAMKNKMNDAMQDEMKDEMRWLKFPLEVTLDREFHITKLIAV